MSEGFDAPLLQLLSNRQGTPAALRLRGNGIRGAALDALLPALAGLAPRLPCLFDADSGLAETLMPLGWRPLQAAQVANGDSRPSSTLPDAVQWLAGDWYLQAPEHVPNAQAASRAMALELVQLVAADAETRELEDVFRRDPTLSYHLLRLVNSVAMGLSRRITSFSQAIVLIGRQQLRRWLNFILFAARDDDPRSAMLLARVAARARQLELLAQAAGRDRAQQDTAFMAGMFSLVGVLFGQPLVQVLQPLKLSEELLAAVLERRGWLGELLGLVEAGERGEFEALARDLAAQGLDAEKFAAAGIEAYAWMLDVLRENGGGHG